MSETCRRCGHTTGGCPHCARVDDVLGGYAAGPLCHLDEPGLSCYQIETVYGGADPRTVHACPREGDDGMMPCCGVPPGERRADRMTLDPALVTCRGRRGWGVGDAVAEGAGDD